MVEKVDVEIIDENGDSVVRPQSAVEQITDIQGYNDLVYKISDLENPEDEVLYGDGKNYYPSMGRSIWKTVIMATKPIIAKNEREKEELLSVYKIIYAFTKAGEYPLMQQLCNYLGVTIDEFYNVLRTNNHPSRRVYLWAHDVFDACASMNAIRSNGNANIRVWIDKSREGKMPAETRVELALETEKLKQITNYGEELNRQLLSGGYYDDDEEDYD